MNNFFKTLIAGYGAKKLGGGCFSTIIIFIIIFWALGKFDGCGSTAQPVKQGKYIHDPSPLVSTYTSAIRL